MNHFTSHHACALPCPWMATGQCLLQQIDGSIIASGHLGAGQLAGVKELYGSHALPPCLTETGVLRWHEGVPTEFEVVPLAWSEDTPGL